MSRMLSGIELAGLKKALPRLLPDTEVLKQLAGASGLEVTRINWSKSAEIVWASVLDEANVEPIKLRRLMIELVEYRESQPELRKWQAYVLERQEQDAHRPSALEEPFSKSPKKTVLVLSASPLEDDLERLRTDKELNLIRQHSERGACREHFHYVPITATSLSDLRSALLFHRPWLVHFTGHGLKEDGLALENEDGSVHAVPSHILEGLLQLSKDETQCVVLNACHSLHQTQKIFPHIQAVVGMNRAISDKAGLAFADGFYEALFNGKTPWAAFRHGIERLREEAPREAETPVYLGGQQLQT